MQMLRKMMKPKLKYLQRQLTPMLFQTRSRIRKKDVLVFIIGLLVILFLYWNYLLKPREIRMRIVTAKIMKAIGGRDNIKARELVKPAFSTIVIQPSLSPCPNNGGSDIYALFVVISSTSHRKRRDAIRATLGQVLRSRSELTNDGDSKQKQFELVFFLGNSTNDAEFLEQTNEQEQYDDIIVDHVLDSYLNLALKSLRMLKWVRSNCENVKYLIKMDDDVHVNVDKVLTFLEEQRENLVGGYKMINDPVERSPFSKWFAPRSLWNAKYYPDFVAGYFYILGRDAAAKIYERSLTIPLFYLEDVYLTGIVANMHLRMEVTDLPNILKYWYPIYGLYTTSCEFQKYPVVHDVPPHLLRCWHIFNSPDFKCSNFKLMYFIC